MLGVPRAELKARVKEALAMVDLEGSKTALSIRSLRRAAAARGAGPRADPQAERAACLMSR